MTVCSSSVSDGSKYRGRGLIQITGRANYMACGEALGLDLIKQPELLEKPQHACMSAAWFWATKGLNTLADADQFDKITRRINGGQNGAADLKALYARALKVLGRGAADHPGPDSGQRVGRMGVAGQHLRPATGRPRSCPPNRAYQSGQRQLRTNSGRAGQAPRPGAMARSQRPILLPSPDR